MSSITNVLLVGEGCCPTRWSISVIFYIYMAVCRAQSSMAPQVETHLIPDDGIIPNCGVQGWPVLVYRQAFDKATAGLADQIETTFAKHQCPAQVQNLRDTDSYTDVAIFNRLPARQIR